MWGLSLRSSQDIQIRCTANEKDAVNLVLVPVKSFARLDRPRAQAVIDTGDYRHGFVATEPKKLPRGDYMLVATTYNVRNVAPLMVDLYWSGTKPAVIGVP